MHVSAARASCDSCHKHLHGALHDFCTQTQRTRVGNKDGGAEFARPGSECTRPASCGSWALSLQRHRRLQLPLQLCQCRLGLC